MIIKNSKWQEIFKVVFSTVGFALAISIALIGLLFLFKILPEGQEYQGYFKGFLFITIFVEILLFMAVTFSLMYDISFILEKYAKQQKLLRRVKVYKEYREKGTRESSFLPRVREIIAEQGGYRLDEVQAESNLKDDLGVDSLDVVELVIATEEEFGIEIPDELEKTFQTPLDFAIFVESQSIKPKK